MEVQYQSGVMGAITFLDKYCPEQFGIMGAMAGNSRANGFNYDVLYVPHQVDRGGCGVANGKGFTPDSLFVPDISELNIFNL